MKRVVLFLSVVLLCATVTWVDTAARDTPWGIYPYRDTGDDHPWGGEQVRPDDGSSQSVVAGGTTTRFFLVEWLSRFVTDAVIDWHSSSYRPYNGGATQDNSGTATMNSQPNQSTTVQEGQ